MVWISTGMLATIMLGGIEYKDVLTAGAIGLTISKADDVSNYTMNSLIQHIETLNTRFLQKNENFIN